MLYVPEYLISYIILILCTISAQRRYPAISMHKGMVIMDNNVVTVKRSVA